MPDETQYTQPATLKLERTGLQYTATYTADETDDFPAWSVNFTWRTRGVALRECLAHAEHKALELAQGASD